MWFDVSVGVLNIVALSSVKLISIRFLRGSLVCVLFGLEMLYFARTLIIYYIKF